MKFTRRLYREGTKGKLLKALQVEGNLEFLADTCKKILDASARQGFVA